MAAENSKILTAEQESQLRQPIDDYVGGIQEKIDALRADGSDKVVIIDGGQIAACGTPVQLKNEHSRNYLRLYGDGAAIAAELRAHGYAAEAEGGACVVVTPSADEARAILARHPRLCRDFEFVKGNMDDVFLAVTGKRLEGGAA